MAYLIAAGGTGQEIAAAVLRLSYLSAKTIPHIAIFDTDVGAKAPESACRTRTQILTSLHQEMLNLRCLDEPRLALYNPARLPKSERTAERIAEKIEDIFGDLGVVSIEDQELMNVILDDSQQQTRIDDGFHGHPALGSLVFSGAVHMGAYEALFAKVFDAVRADKSNRIVLVASLTGGVGTSVVPVLIQKLDAIRRSVSDNKDVRITAVLQLPWFRLETAVNEAGSQEPDVTAAMLDRNACCLIEGYLNQTDDQGQASALAQIDRVVLVGLPRPVPRISQGGNLQHETRHYLNLVTAIAVMNLMSDDGESLIVGTRQEQKFVAPAVRMQPPWDVLRGGTAATRLCLTKERSLSIEQLAKIASCLVATTRAACFEVGNTNPSLSHHESVRRVLHALTGLERDNFKEAIRHMTVHHEEILSWLADTVYSSAGSRRADTLNVFVPESERLFDPSVRPVLEALGLNPAFAIAAVDRRILQRLNPKTEKFDGDGRLAAWRLTESARKTVLDQVR